MANHPSRAIFRPNAQQLTQLAVPPVVHNPLLSKLPDVTGGSDSDQDSPVPYFETPSRWTLTACTVKSAMTTASCYSQGSWDMDSPVETVIKTDPRRFAIALSPGRLVLSASLWTHDEHYEDEGSDEYDDSDSWDAGEGVNWEMVSSAQIMTSNADVQVPPQKRVRWASTDDVDEGQNQFEIFVIEPPDPKATVVPLENSPLSDGLAKPVSLQVESSSLGTMIIAADRSPNHEHNWPEEMEKELDAIDTMQREKKKRSRIYSVAYKRASRPTKIISRMLSRLSVQPHTASPSPAAAPKRIVARKASPPAVRYSRQLTPNRRRSRASMRPQSRRLSRFQLPLPDVSHSPLSVSFEPSSPDSYKPPTPYPDGVPPYDPEAGYDRFQAMERLRKLVTPLTSNFSPSGPSAPSPQASVVAIALPPEPVIDKYHAMDKLRKLRFSAAGTPHKQSHSNSSYNSDWDFHDSPLQMLRPPNSPPPLPSIPGNKHPLRKRSSTGQRHRPSPLKLTPAVALAF